LPSLIALPATPALAQERKPGGGGTWHCFDDNAVDPWDVACLEKDCYGGRFTADVWDAKTNQHVPHVRTTFPEPKPAVILTPNSLFSLTGSSL
jgi:hypothetical protein